LYGRFGRRIGTHWHDLAHHYGIISSLLGISGLLVSLVYSTHQILCTRQNGGDFTLWASGNINIYQLCILGTEHFYGFEVVL